MDSRAVRTFRLFVIVTAAVGIVLGVTAIVWPRPALVLVAIVFGVYLVVAGVLRVVAALNGRGASGTWRWVSGVVGVLVAIGGLVCLLDPAAPLLVLALLAGIGFIVEGIAALVGAFVGHPGSSRVPAVVSGVLSLVVGIAVLVAPGVALTVFVVVAGIALVVVGIAALLLLPARAAARR
ncbi:HdeD family acid-resistance protein [Curtobacterium sp. RRHDQ10]|uniref:HdeD family acid-resistance protein n=1 Tax=Curtobacterium phyllosphaerae TaxID=3413379 RepID=UPI003BEFC81D